MLSQVVVGQQPDQAADRLSESERIRASWRKQNFVSLRCDKKLLALTPEEASFVGSVPLSTDEVPIQMAETDPLSTDEVPVEMAEQTVNTLDIVDDDIAAAKKAVVPVISVSSGVVQEERIETVAAQQLVKTSEAFPVDLPTILRLAGGRNWAVQLAWERINQAEAQGKAMITIMNNMRVGYIHISTPNN